MMISFLNRSNAPNLAYVKIEGQENPTILFLGGFRSDMEGTKALYLQDYCQKNSLSFIRFDYQGHGSSEGDFKDGSIGDWLQDVIDIIDNLANSSVVLIGSSMGGWLSLLTAINKPDSVKAMIGIAAAPDFTLWIEEKISDSQKQDLEQQGYFEQPNDYSDEPYIFTKKLIEDGRSHCLLDKSIDLNIPIRLIQGMKDMDVEWQTAHRIKNAINSDDVEVFLIEDADHRLSRDQDLELLSQQLGSLLERI